MMVALCTSHSDTPMGGKIKTFIVLYETVLSRKTWPKSNGRPPVNSLARHMPRKSLVKPVMAEGANKDRLKTFNA